MPKTSKNLVVFRGSAGLGLKTLREFKKGDEVVEYTGEMITTEEADRRGGRYLFEVNDNWTIDGKERANLGRYINHSCRPNCEAIHYEDDANPKEDQIMIVAKRNIKAGEELTYDYGKAHFNEYIKPYGCKCEKCRGHFARG